MPLTLNVAILIRQSQRGSTAHAAAVMGRKARQRRLSLASHWTRQRSANGHRCVGNAAKASMTGDAPSATFLEEKVKALRELTHACRSFLAAMTGA